jgi:hypothetical protein
VKDASVQRSMNQSRQQLQNLRGIAIHECRAGSSRAETIRGTLFASMISAGHKRLAAQDIKRTTIENPMFQLSADKVHGFCY